MESSIQAIEEAAKIRLKEIDKELSSLSEKQNSLSQEKSRLSIFLNGTGKRSANSGTWSLHKGSLLSHVKEILISKNKPMHVCDIRNELIKLGLNTSNLYTSLGRSNHFYRVEKGVYGLTEWLKKGN